MTVGPGPDDGDNENVARLVEIYRRHARELTGLALAVTHDRSQAEDIVHDAVLRVYSGPFRRLRNDDRLLAYLRTAVLNGSRDYLRRAVRRRGVESELAHSAAASTTGGDHDPATAVAGVSDLLLAVHGLPRRQREVLLLRYYSDLSVAETAATLRISSTAVKASAHRALESIRQNWRGEPR